MSGRKAVLLQPVDPDIVKDAIICVVRSGTALVSGPNTLRVTIDDVVVYPNITKALAAVSIDAVYPGIDDEDLACALYSEQTHAPALAPVQELRLRLDEPLTPSEKYCV